MSIFGNLLFDDTVQVAEKVRLDASTSFVTQDEAAVSLVRIEPEAGNGYITVSGVSVSQKDWVLDWGYATDGAKVISLEITTDGAPVVTTYNLTVLTVVDDALFAGDQDLKKFEPDIMKWLPSGKSTWNFIHRKVQEKILTEIYKLRIFAKDGTKLEKTEVIDKAEVREWATFAALAIIFKGIQNATDDVFGQKAIDYTNKANQFMQYSLNVLALDYDKDGTIDLDTEKMDFRSGGLFRR